MIDGRVVGLWRHPIKSLGGERCQELTLDARGVAGDRVWALVDPDGGIASGKTTRRFRKVAGLLRHEARVGRDGIPVLHLADGRVVSPTKAIAEELAGSGWRFAREGAVSHLDAGPVHLVTTAALASLGAAAGEAVEPERLRPNLLLDLGSEREDHWHGRRLSVGEAELRVTAPTERCVMVGHQHGELPPRPQLLHMIGRWNGACAGVYAAVVRPGRVRVDDRVRVL